MIKVLRFSAILLLILTLGTANAQHQFGNSRISGDFGFNGMYYIPDSLIGAEKVDSKVRANAFLNLLYTNGGFSAGMRYEFYMFPLLDFEKIGYQGQGIKYFFADYKNKFVQVTAGTFYEQFGNGLALRAYEERQLGIDNSLLGARVKVTPYKGIIIKGVWGIERVNFESYIGRTDHVRGLDGEIILSELIPKMQEKGFMANIGASFVSKFQATNDDIYVTLHPDVDSLRGTGVIPADKVPENVPTWATRLSFGYKGFRLDGEFAQKMNDPNITNEFIYRKGNALFLSATYAMKGFGIAASFIRADNMDFRSQRFQNKNALCYINNIPAINRQYSYQLIGNYSFASQPNSQIGAQLQVNYQIPKKSKIGGKYGTDLTFNYSRFHSIDQQPVDEAVQNGTMSGSLGYTSSFFKFGPDLLYQDIGLEISRRFTKHWKLILAYNYITYNIDKLQGHPGMMRGHLVAADLQYKITNKHALRLEAQHLYTKDDKGSWVYGMLEYSISPHWFISVGDQWNYGNENANMRLHYYNVAAAYVWNTTRVAVNFGKTQEGILCIGGVCRAVPASYGFGLSLTTSF
ncbi:MAG: hypothetical protein J6T13_11445 [Bacteroidales bacterium]|nr:hypothetical protein [Bacteroidales bacterium]